MAQKDISAEGVETNDQGTQNKFERERTPQEFNTLEDFVAYLEEQPDRGFDATGFTKDKPKSHTMGELLQTIEKALLAEYKLARSDSQDEGRIYTQELMDTDAKLMEIVKKVEDWAWLHKLIKAKLGKEQTLDLPPAEYPTIESLIAKLKIAGVVRPHDAKMAQSMRRQFTEAILPQKEGVPSSFIIKSIKKAADDMETAFRLRRQDGHDTRYDAYMSHVEKTLHDITRNLNPGEDDNSPWNLREAIRKLLLEKFERNPDWQPSKDPEWRITR